MDGWDLVFSLLLRLPLSLFFFPCLVLFAQMEKDETYFNVFLISKVLYIVHTLFPKEGETFFQQPPGFFSPYL
jgi:hypothetical protein